MKTSRIILAVTAAAIQTTAWGADFTAWSRKAEVKFSGYTGTETLTNFPALVVLGADTIQGFDSADCLAGGADLRFSDAAGTVELAYEIEKWNPAGKSFVWVRVPELAGTNTSISAYWGKEGATAPAYTTNGAVWANGYVAVYHLAEGGGPATDSSSCRNAAAVYNGVVQGVAGAVGPGAGWPDGNNDWLQAPDRDELDGMGQLTLQAWMCDTQTTSAARALISKRVSSSSNRAYFLYKVSSTGNLQLSLGETGAEFSGSKTEKNRWYAVAATYDKVPASNRMKLYLDGKFTSSLNVFSGNIPATAGNLHIGILNANYGAAWMGQLDEVRISNVARSPAWLQADFLTAASNAVFQSYGIAQNVTPGLPFIQTTPATNVTATAAWLCGNLISTGATATAVTAYWGATDEGTNAADWAASASLAAPRTPGEFSLQATGLAPSTRHYARYAASNEAGVAWSAAAVDFTTLPGAPLAANGAATGVLDASATLHGAVAYAGVPPTTLYAFWATNDCGILCRRADGSCARDDLLLSGACNQSLRAGGIVGA